MPSSSSTTACTSTTPWALRRYTVCAACIDLWAAACGLVLFYGIKRLHGLRVDSRIEEEGLDIYEHGESCYN